MRPPVHRSEAPLPRRLQRAALRERFARARRESAERAGQLELSIFEPACAGTSGGAARAAKMPEVPPHVTPRTRPTHEQIAAEPWRVFD